MGNHPMGTDGVIVLPGFVALGFTLGTKLMVALTWSPLASPNAMLQVTPLADWAAVGGQG
jgi:hypothetical protein